MTEEKKTWFFEKIFVPSIIAAVLLGILSLIYILK